MLNTTILQLLISHSLGSPFLTPSSTIQISKSSFSFFSSNFLYSRYSSSVTKSKFFNFLSSAIKINGVDRFYAGEFINSRVEVKELYLHVNVCVFQNCVASAGGGGGAIFISGGTIEVNHTGFQNCHASYERSNGGAIYTDSNLVILNGLCADNCYSLESGQSFYLLDSDSHLEFITISRCGLESPSPFAAETISVSGKTNIQNLNSTSNLAKLNAAGICCTKTTSAYNLQIIYSSFVGNTGNSVVDISAELDDTISYTNFVSNVASQVDSTTALIFSYGFGTKPIFSQCVFKSNTYLKLVDKKVVNNEIRFINCFSDADNWGDATLSNCIVSNEPTINNVFYKDGVCDGRFQIPVQTPNGAQPGNPDQPVVPDTTIITSLFPLASPTASYILNYITTNKKDAGKIVAIVFCVLEALLIIILIIAIILLIMYYRTMLNKARNQKDEEKKEEDENQFTIVDEEEEVNDLNTSNEDQNTKNKTAFVPTPHMPSSESSPSGARRIQREREKVLTPQIPRKKRRRHQQTNQNDQINEHSPLIEERKKLRIVFSSSTDSDVE